MKCIPGLKALIPFGILCGIAGAFCYTVNADSTITIPVDMPVNNPDRNVTLSLRIPAQTQPITRAKAQMKPAIVSNRIYVWDSNPSPKLAADDEIHDIFSNMNRKGYVTTEVNKVNIRNRPLDKYIAVRILIHISENIINLGKAKNFDRVVKKCKLTSSDVEDVRRMVKRFEKDIVTFYNNPNKMDKDLLIIQERLKKTKQGILKVLRVEGNDDGSTVIHMTVD